MSGSRSVRPEVPTVVVGRCGNVIVAVPVEIVGLKVEALINTVILGVLGLFMLLRLEERSKRRAVFRELHSLRSLIHIIDMHQLTKDPAALAPGIKPTVSSPTRLLIWNWQPNVRFQPVNVVSGKTPYAMSMCKASVV